MWSKRSKAAGKVNTLIGRDTELRGDVLFNGGLHVDGTIRGNIVAEEGSGSVLSLSERGLIEGEVKVPNIVLNGCVNGDVHAAEHVELAAHARVNGNVYYKLIEMARGAEVNGNLVHRAEPAEEKGRVAVPEKSQEPKAQAPVKKESVNTPHPAPNAVQASDNPALPAKSAIK